MAAGFHLPIRRAALRARHASSSWRDVRGWNVSGDLTPVGVR
jgi:hypothetical protein